MRSSPLLLLLVLCLAAVGAIEGSYAALPPFEPGDPLPSSVSVPTLNNGQFDIDPASGAGLPLIVSAYNATSGMSQALWHSNSSLTALLENGPRNVHYLFLSYSQGSLAAQDTYHLQGRLNDTMDALNLPASTKASWLAHLHFASTAVPQVGGWISDVAANWTAATNLASISIGGGAAALYPRLDARFAWMPGPTFSGNPVAMFGDGCKATPQQNVSGKLALMSVAASSACDYYTMLKHAQDLGARGVVTYQVAGAPLVNMNCDTTAECNDPTLAIQATQVPYEAGASMAAALMASPPKPVSLGLAAGQTQSLCWGASAAGELEELGILLYPSMHFLAWEAQWLDYKIRLTANLTRPGVLVVPIFQQRSMQGHPGVVVNVTLPALSKLAQYEHMELDMALSCPGMKDATCPHWDHTVRLFVTCDSDVAAPGPELGRWISPFRRRIGRWLTPVDQLLPLLTSQDCTFTMQTVPWAMTWVPSLNLRFWGARATPATAPAVAQPLFNGEYTFNASYNTRSPIKVMPPAASQATGRVMLEAVITGHGSDNNNCGEFCISSHHFIINGVANVVTYNEAGTALGCAANVPLGVEPNEFGTWLYGRDGWCDGQDVRPWVVDVTDQVHAAGSQQPNVVEYKAYYCSVANDPGSCVTPHPTHSPGYMIVQSNLVFYDKL